MRKRHWEKRTSVQSNTIHYTIQFEPTCTFNPKPPTRKPKPSTLNPQPEIRPVPPAHAAFAHGTQQALPRSQTKTQTLQNASFLNGITARAPLRGSMPERAPLILVALLNQGPSVVSSHYSDALLNPVWPFGRNAYKNPYRHPYGALRSLRASRLPREDPGTQGSYSWA